MGGSSVVGPSPLGRFFSQSQSGRFPTSDPAIAEKNNKRLESRTGQPTGVIRFVSVDDGQNPT